MRPIFFTRFISLFVSLFATLLFVSTFVIGTIQRAAGASDHVFTTEFSPPLYRSKNLESLGQKKIGTFLAYSRYLSPYHGLSLGLDIQNFGHQGVYNEEMAHIESKNSNDDDHLGAINAMGAYSYRHPFLAADCWWFFLDLGPGLYRLTGIQDESANRFLLTLNQKYSLSYQTPMKLGDFESTTLQVGPTLSHHWIRPTVFRGTPLGGHEVSLGMHLKLFFAL